MTPAKEKEDEDQLALLFGHYRRRVCDQCGMPLGYRTEEGIFIMGGLALTEAHGRCTNCDAPFHWRQPPRMTPEQMDERLNRLVDRVIRMRRKYGNP